MNYNTYDVAVMNYPLFDINNETDNLQDYIFVHQRKENFDVPIYIHIPFCDSLCDFCIYNRMLLPKNNDIVDLYIDALIREIQLYASYEYIQMQKIGSVFLGGGTPSVLSEKQLYKILNALKENFYISRCEITVECSVNSAVFSKLRLLKSLGVTRISTGVQTFDDVLRKKLHIQNSSNHIVNWLKQAKELNFTDLSIDLIFGFPGTDTSHFLFDLEKPIGLNLMHISVYKLAAFAYTKLYRDIQNGLCDNLPTKKQMYQIFTRAHNFLLDNNFFVQSTQEYGQMGKTTKFWDLTYDGYGNNISFGSSSFGYINRYCYQNESSVDKYIKKLNTKMLPIERISPRITEKQQKERAMIIGFRKGSVSKTLFLDTFKSHIIDIFFNQINKQLQDRYIYETKEGYYLTPKGLYHQGLVSADYMLSIFNNVSPLKKKMCIGSHEMPH